MITLCILIILWTIIGWTIEIRCAKKEERKIDVSIHGFVFGFSLLGCTVITIIAILSAILTYLP